LKMPTQLSREVWPNWGRNTEEERRGKKPSDKGETERNKIGREDERGKITRELLLSGNVWYFGKFNLQRKMVEGGEESGIPEFYN